MKEQKEKLEEIMEMLNDLSTGIHISERDTVLSSYTRAIEVVENHRVIIKIVLDKLDNLIDE